MLKKLLRLISTSTRFEFFDVLIQKIIIVIKKKLLSLIRNLNMYILHRNLRILFSMAFKDHKFKKMPYLNGNLSCVCELYSTSKHDTRG